MPLAILEHVMCGPAPGPLYLLFPLSGMLFPKYLHGLNKHLLEMFVHLYKNLLCPSLKNVSAPILGKHENLIIIVSELHTIIG
jgi:hypothetical protein